MPMTDWVTIIALELWMGLERFLRPPYPRKMTAMDRQRRVSWNISESMDLFRVLMAWLLLTWTELELTSALLHRSWRWMIKCLVRLLAISSIGSSRLLLPRLLNDRDWVVTRTNVLNRAWCSVRSSSSPSAMYFFSGLPKELFFILLL